MSKYNKERVTDIVNSLKTNVNFNVDFLFDVYDIAYDSIVALLEEQNIQNVKIDSSMIISYLLGEYIYSTTGISEESLKSMIGNEKIKESMAGVTADKYLSLSLYAHKEKKLTSEFLPPISSINLYINLMANFVSQNKRNDPKNTLITDLLAKSISIAKSIIGLLTDGYETEAFAVWRTLHECECTLILLDKYKDVAINAYLKHMRFGIAFKDGLPNKEEQAKIIDQIKNEMREYGLKSKDTKKYIEYGWLNNIPGKDELPGFKLNFRDGLESLAGLHAYSDVYMMSSEILHSTPLLIYSNKKYFYSITLLNLYESFFRIEKVFQTLFFEVAGEVGKTSYMEMRKLYYSQLINIHSREKKIFLNSFTKKKTA